MSNSDSRGAGRPRDEAVDAQILQATVQLLLEHDDPDTISISAIVARSGSSRAALYRRWVTREALFAQALDTVRDTAVFVSTGNPVADVLAFFSTQRRDDADFQNLLLKRQILMLRSARVRAIYADEFMNRRREILRRGLAGMQDEGHLSTAADIDALLDLVYGVHYLHYLVVPGRPDANERTRRATEAALAPYLAG